MNTTDPSPSSPSIDSSPAARHVLLTGATGFVGKVVLYELVRRQRELGIESVTLLVREGRRGKADARLRRVVESRCFEDLPSGWNDFVGAVGGDLVLDGCGIGADDAARLKARVTHVVHCAASIDFDLPVQEAAQANIDSALNMLDFAKVCRGPVRMVAVSTAYVAPHPGGDGVCEPELVELPRPAEQLLADIRKGVDSKVLLAETGHPNTYTYTKCLAEHLLRQRAGDLPLTIVRPSIVSASWALPFPGWIDSNAAFAGFVGLIGAGHLQIIVGQRDARLDIVPVDCVAARIVEAGFGDDPRPIRYAVAGLDGSSEVGKTSDIIAAFFTRHSIDRVPYVAYVGPRGARYRAAHWRHQKGPAQLVKTWLKLRGDKRQGRRLAKLIEKLDYLNEAFPYFTQNTYDFRGDSAVDTAEFSAAKYVEVVCRGVYRYLVGKDETEMSFAGRQHTDGRADVPWALSRPFGNWAIRGSGFAVRGVLRRCAERVTFDLPSFEAARAAVPEGTLMVIVPNHRSYLDFLLCSYLFFERADLGIGIPHIAAASEFSRLPGLGWLFRQTQAFYIRRGTGAEDPDLTRRIEDLVARGQTLEFFIEGTRSRSRRYLTPKRGLLRALQGTGINCALLPVAITYDRVPEEDAFQRELSGGGKPKMGLSPLIKWLRSAGRGEVALGRVHMRCGEPVTLGPDDDVHAVSRAVVGRLQSEGATSTYHLRAFLAAHPDLPYDLGSLRAELVRRGGLVIDSTLEGGAIDAQTERSLRYQWLHLFYPDLAQRMPVHPALSHHRAAHGFADEEALANLPAPGQDRALEQLLEILFAPICRDYQRVAEALGPDDGALLAPTAAALVRQASEAHLPDLHAAFDDLLERQIIVAAERPGGLAWGPRQADLPGYRAACAWPEGAAASPLDTKEGRDELGTDHRSERLSR
jgi:fatty acyl-CoA reductase